MPAIIAWGGFKMKRIAVVTGGNRGIGRAAGQGLARLGWRVVLAARDAEKGEAAARQMREEGGDAVFRRLDIDDDAQARDFGRWAAAELGRVDALLNNAGIYVEGDSAADIRANFETNVLGPWRLTQAILPLMRQQRFGRIVNVSSGMGQLSEMGGGSPAYRISKTALNAVTRIIAAETAGENILVNSVCPGWVKTDMGGEGADRTPEQGADTLIWLATLPDGGPTGGFFRDRKPIPW
jgi:NAD(P)-dependent dehydrogenase (short-subunit alcohol dehydrogenase family)